MWVICDWTFVYDEMKKLLSKSTYIKTNSVVNEEKCYGRFLSRRLIIHFNGTLSIMVFRVIHLFFAEQKFITNIIVAKQQRGSEENR